MKLKDKTHTCLNRTELCILFYKSGLLCRDVSAEGLRFYVNLFNEIDSANIYS